MRSQAEPENEELRITKEAAMTIQQIYDRLLQKFGSDKITGLGDKAKDPWVNVASSAISEVSRFLRDDPELQLDQLCDLTGVDYLETDPKLAAKFPYPPHLEVVYHLYSFNKKHRCVIKASLPRWKNDQEGQLPEISTVSHIWPIADWHEREAYDLMGIRFLGHPNLVRILCVDDWEGHPLRKDYKFPLEYHGMRG
jgi:NADH-quinone oxidoreductase subunit C